MRIIFNRANYLSQASTNDEVAKGEGFPVGGNCSRV